MFIYYKTTVSCHVKKRIDAISQGTRSKKSIYISSAKDSNLNAYDCFCKLKFEAEYWNFKLGNNHEELCNKVFYPSRDLIEKIIKSYDRQLIT